MPLNKVNAGIQAKFLNTEKIYIQFYRNKKYIDRLNINPPSNIRILLPTLNASCIFLWTNFTITYI